MVYRETNEPIRIKAHHLLNFWLFIVSCGANKENYLEEMTRGPYSINYSEYYGENFLSYAAGLWQHLKENPERILVVTNGLDALCEACKIVKICSAAPSSQETSAAEALHVEIGASYKVRDILEKFRQ
jgi:hypothetical protein